VDEIKRIWNMTSYDGTGGRDRPTTQNILHAWRFDLRERRFKLKHQRTRFVGSIERHAVYLNVVGH
jgi:hypothetical protein